MDCSMPGLPVHHQLPEFVQIHVHWIGDAIQPSHPLSSPSPPAFNLSHHQGLFKWVSSSHQVAKVLEFLVMSLKKIFGCVWSWLGPAGSCAVAPRLSSCRAWASLLHGSWDLSSPTRDGICIPRVAGQILNHWTPQGHLYSSHLDGFFLHGRPVQNHFSVYLVTLFLVHEFFKVYYLIFR